MSCTISQEQYSIWSLFLVLYCKIMISSGVFFIFFKFWFFRLLGSKRAKNSPKWKITITSVHLSHTISQEQYSVWSFLVHYCKIMISPGIFLIFVKFWFFGLLAGKGGKRTKNGPKQQKILSRSISQELYIIWLSFVVHMCSRCFFQVFRG